MKDKIKRYINESDDFEWTSNVSDNPLRWVKPEINLDNVERDEEGYPSVMGDGQGEIWVDVTDFTETQKRSVISSIEELLGSPLRLLNGGNYRVKGYLIHCGHEDNDFFSQENEVCSMGDSYQDFIETDGYRPYVDGSIFLDDTKQDLTEGTMYYKGVNPTVDFIVRRDDEILLIKRGSQSEMEPNKWALPGGFHDSNAKEGGRWKQDKESTLEAAKRELKEETGLDLSKFPDVIIEKVGTFEGIGREPEDESWVQTTVYKTTIPNDAGEDVKGMDDAQDAKWFTVYDTMNMDLAFNHKDHIEKSLVLVEDAFSNISISELLRESNDFDWVEDIPDEVDFDLWVEVSGHIDYELSGPPMDIVRRRPKFKQLRSILGDFDLDIEDLSDFFEFPPTLRNGEPMINQELMDLRTELVNYGFIYEGDDLYESVDDDFEWVKDIQARPFYVGGRFIDTNDHDDELIYTVDDISGDVVKLSWYSEGEHQTWNDRLYRLEGRYENGHIISID